MPCGELKECSEHRNSSMPAKPVNFVEGYDENWLDGMEMNIWNMEINWNNAEEDMSREAGFSERDFVIIYSDANVSFLSRCGGCALEV